MAKGQTEMTLELGFKREKTAVLKSRSCISHSIFLGLLRNTNRKPLQLEDPASTACVSVNMKGRTRGYNDVDAIPHQTTLGIIERGIGQQVNEDLKVAMKLNNNTGE